MEYHPSPIEYSISHKYNPDFKLVKGDTTYYIEVKGYFQDAHELQKYPWIADSLGDNEELVFVFENPHKPIHFQAKRKDGSRITHAEWAEKKRFRWFSEESLKEFING